MFQKGERIVYGNIGVCEVTDIRLFQCAGMEERQYYILRPLHIAGEILIPINTSVYMRPIMTQQEAKRLIDQIPTIQAAPYYSTALTELSHHYEEVIHSHNNVDLLSLAMSIFAKKKIRADNKQKTGLIDEKYLKRAEDLIFYELSAVLEIPRDEVPGYIASRVNSRKKELKHESCA